MVIRRHRALEMTAIALLLLSATLDPLLTFGLAAALVGGGLALVYLDEDHRDRER
jgi:hypothetical protein